MKKIILLFPAFLFVIFTTQGAMAITQTIGDKDGFGFDKPNQYQSAQNEDPDTDGNGILESSEFLPDIDENGKVKVNSDEFDNRSDEEINSQNGAQFTDHSLTDTNAYTQANDAVFNFSFDVPHPGDNDYQQDHYINLV